MSVLAYFCVPASVNYISVEQEIRDQKKKKKVILWIIPNEVFCAESLLLLIRINCVTSALISLENFLQSSFRSTQLLEFPAASQDVLDTSVSQPSFLLAHGERFCEQVAETPAVCQTALNFDVQNSASAKTSQPAQWL